MTGDAGYRLRAMATYSDNTGIGRSATSGPTAPVYQPGTVVLSPDAPKVGEPVTARFSHPESAPEDQTWSWKSSPGTGEPVWSIHPWGDGGQLHASHDGCRARTTR